MAVGIEGTKYLKAKIKAAIDAPKYRMLFNEINMPRSGVLSVWVHCVLICNVETFVIMGPKTPPQIWALSKQVRGDSQRNSIYF